MWYLKNYDELTKEEIVAIYKARIEIFIVGQDLNYQEIDDKDKKSWHLFEMNDVHEVISYLRILSNFFLTHWIMVYKMSGYLNQIRVLRLLQVLSYPAHSTSS